MTGRLPLKAVLFDWDGTLVDSAPATFECYRQVFAAYGIAFDERRFRETYSPNWYETYRRVGLPEEHWPQADDRWLSLYARQRALPLPQAAVVLARLAGAGLRLGLVTAVIAAASHGRRQSLLWMASGRRWCAPVRPLAPSRPLIRCSSPWRTLE